MGRMLSPVAIRRAWREWTPVRSLGVEVHARVWTDAPAPATSTPLVLVAGVGVSSRYWRRLGRRLAEFFHVMSPDLPGFGSTPTLPGARWPAGPDVREQADQLLAWMDARGIDRAILCGHSVGCQTVVDVAARFPERVERIILLAPTFDSRARSLFGQIGRLALGGLVEAPSLHLVLGVEYGSAGAARAVQQASRALHYPMEATLPHVTTPALVVCGRLDPLSGPRWTSRVTWLLPRALLVVVDRVGHAMHYSSPAITAKLIGDFIQNKLSASHPPEDKSVVEPQDNPRRDPLGPPQPISPAVHVALDYAVSVAAVVVPRVLRWSPRARRLLSVAAGISLANNLLTDSKAGAARKLPMVTHATVDVASGIYLLLAAATYARREPAAARLAIAGLGLYQFAAAALTGKPTGPARHFLGEAGDAGAKLNRR
ncbi:MAG TPA: alpha/beta hydrolase [Tepidisphaeraceae bacterium]